MRFADELFRAKGRLANLESELWDHIMRALGLDPNYIESFDKLPFEDITYDGYDGSFELKGAPVGYDLPQSARDYMADLGFAQFWVCRLDKSEVRHVIARPHPDTRENEGTP